MASQRKIGIILSYVSEGIKIFTGLIYTPIMLRLLGQNEYGLYQLIFSTVSYLGLLSMGFNSSYIRFYSRYKAQNNNRKIAKLNGMFLCIFLIISIICGICGIFMFSNIQFIFANRLTNNEYKIAKILMVLMIINLIITFLNSVFDCNLIAHEKFIFQKLLSLTQSILSPFLTLPLLLLNKGSIAIVFVSTILTFFCFILNIVYNFKIIKIQFIFKNLDFLLLKEMWIFTFYIFISQIIDQVNWNVDRFLLGRIKGIEAVAVYSIGAQINSIYLQFSTSISSVFIPEVNKIVAKTNDNSELIKLLTKVGRIQFIIMGLILSGFILIGFIFIEIWAGKEYLESYYITLFLIVPVTVPLIQNLGIEIQRAKNMHKSRSLIYLIISICNIFISIPLIRTFGAIGAAIGTALALIAGNIIFINFYYHFRIRLNMIYFWKNILKLLPALLFSIIYGILFKYLFVVNSFFRVIIFVGFYSLVYIILMWFLGFNNYERKLVMDIIQKAIKKERNI